MNETPIMGEDWPLPGDKQRIWKEEVARLNSIYGVGNYTQEMLYAAIDRRVQALPREQESK